MKKSVLLLLILTILLATSFVFAQNETGADKGYACLKNKLGDNCGNTANSQEAAFNILAMSFDSSVQSKCKSSLMSIKQDNCWGQTASSSCDIKSTAIAILALKSINENADPYVQWLNDHRKISSGLNWYLEIDSNNITGCDINGKKITILENKKLSGGDPLGLTKAYNGYWYKITDINKNFTISCNTSFITALIYQKSGYSTFFVSSKTDSAAPFDSITEQVSSYCFSTGNNCDYEGSLWATLALTKAGEDFFPYIPYISAMSDDASNKKYLPSAFLYMLFHSIDDYSTALLDQQKNGKYWEVSGNKLYDTAIALLALSDTNYDQSNSAKDYLLTLQDSSGCWSSNTNLILYAGWRKQPTFSQTQPSTPDCEAQGFNHYCVSAGDCPLNSTLDNFYCPLLSDRCCAVRPPEETCDEKGGSVCNNSQTCSGSEVVASDTGKCCKGTCTVLQKVNQCENQGYVCKDSCDSKKQQEVSSLSSSCDFGQLCCEEKTVPPSNINWALIIILIILIILVIIAIIFRNQLRMWLLKFKSGTKVGPGPKPTNRPPMPPPGQPGRFPLRPMQRPMPPRPGQQPPLRAPIRRPAPAPLKKGPKDEDFEETMKKLRDMSK